MVSHPVRTLRTKRPRGRVCKEELEDHIRRKDDVDQSIDDKEAEISAREQADLQLLDRPARRLQDGELPATLARGGPDT